MALLQAQVSQPKSTTDFKHTTFEFQEKDVHPLDQINMHRLARDMVYSTFTHTAITASKLQLTLNNVQSQLKLEKISSLDKDTRIKYLEEMVVKDGLGQDNSKSTEEMIRKKNVDIATLKKKLKLPTMKDP